MPVGQCCPLGIRLGTKSSCFSYTVADILSPASTGTACSLSASRPWPTSRPAACPCSWPPASPPGVSTSRTSCTSLTTTCRTTSTSTSTGDVCYPVVWSLADVWHRIGRTGRLGNKGRASSFFDGRDDDKLARPLVKVGASFHQKYLPSQVSNFSLPHELLFL